MADGTVTIKANFDGKDAESGVSRIKSALGGLKDSGSKVGSVFKSVLGANLVSSALIGGFQTIKNAILDVGSAALSEGAKLEQSFGGIDTLYKGAEKEAKGFAATAYKAGISANTYAEQAVSFGASLKQALGGDAVTAAKAADKAIMAMADNSAKMGTDIGVVQQTYQSLARGNFAMLDNLKLGFGGTKAEMERLLKTAEDLTGKKYDISNFADITEAIDEVQKSLGIAGVAAQEAETTLSGSLNAMKASFQNVLGAIAGTELDMKPALEGLATTTSNFLFGNFIPMVGRVMKNLPEAIGVFIESARPALEQGLSKVFSPDVVEKALKVFDNMVSFGSKIKTFFSNFADTGALSSLKTALGDVGTAIGNIFTAITGSAALSGFKGDWTDLGTTIGDVVKSLSEGASKVADFIAKMDPAQLRSWMATIGAVVGGFKIFTAVTGSSPIGALLDKLGSKFSIFGNKGKEGTDKAGSGTGLLGQLFQGMGTLITSVANGISTILQGLGTALSTVAQGFGRAVSMANPAQWLSFGAAMLMVGAGVALASAGITMLVDAAIRLGEAGTSAGIALVGLGVGIAAMAGVFALLGPALTASAIGIIAFGAAVLMIGAGIAIASAGLSLLAGHLPTIAAHGVQAGVGIAALGAGLLVVGAGALVAGAGLMVAGAGLVVVGAGAVVAAAGALALGAGLLVAAAGVAAFGVALNLGKPGLTAFANAVTQVVNALSGGIVAILNSVSGVITSVGGAALNAGKGFNQLANGVVKITNTNLGDMAASLGAVAAGIGKIAGQSAGLATAGAGMTALATGMRMFSTSATMATAAFSALPMLLTTFSSSLTAIQANVTSAQASLMTFGASAVSSLAGLSGAAASVVTFTAMLATIVGASTAAGAGLGIFNGQANVSSVVLATLGARATASSAQIMTLGATIMSAMSGASTAIAAAGTRMTTTMQSTFNQMTNHVRNGMTNMTSAVRNGGSQMVAAFRATGTQLVAAAQSMVNQAVNAVRSGYGAMVSAGSYIGQGLAVGMNSALGAVTAAANALVAQAERAAQAKAKINSPSHLFRDQVGWWIGLGIAKGIDNSAPEVANSLDFIREQVAGFNVKMNDVLGSSTAKLSSQLKVETLRGKTPKAQSDARQEAYVAHSASLLEDVIDGLAALKEQVAQGQITVLDTGALVGGTVGAYDSAFGFNQVLKGRHEL